MDAAAEVREGRVFCLSLPLDLPGGNYHGLNRRPPKIHPMERDGRTIDNHRKNDQRTDVTCDDWIVVLPGVDPLGRARPSRLRVRRR